MSIDWLLDLERGIDGGKDIFACPALSRNQWLFTKVAEELRSAAQKTADQKKLPVAVVRVLSKGEAIAGDMFLVPVSIGNPGPRGEPTIEWKQVDTREAAEMMRDVRHGSSPVFATREEFLVDPANLG